VIWHIFLSPIEFSEKKGPLATKQDMTTKQIGSGKAARQGSAG
jgi:hypothetical protein